MRERFKFAIGKASDSCIDATRIKRLHLYVTYLHFIVDFQVIAKLKVSAPQLSRHHQKIKDYTL
jgi:hypothetical protein